jgi:transglutaminase-like putative cysteine protease
VAERLDARAFGLLCASVAAAIATHLAHLPAWLWLATAALVPLRAWQRHRRGGPVSAWIRLPATVLLVALVVVQYGNLFGREPGSVLACGLLALKLLEAERVRDARVALAFAAFVLMSALLFDQALAFTLLIFALLGLLLAGLAALQPAPLERAHPLRRDLRTAGTLLAASLPFAVAAFVFLPRLGSPLWGAPGNDGVSRTGLSETMAPGSMTDLLLDDTPALRVEFEGAPPAQQFLYFRTLVLWDFDGTTWSRAAHRPPFRTEPLQASQATRRYDITLEPTGQRWLPALDLPLDAPERTRFSTDRVLVAADPVAQPRRYRVTSTLRYTLAPTLPAGERARALALPSGFDPRARALAADWRARATSDADVVQSALDLFHARFTYTLEAPLLGRDSIDDFLFDTQRGFCEHYASAFVFLMRAAGIPARVVTGYQGGWWSEADRYLLVRQSDAHAWAEVWSAGRGWWRVDPTAAVSPARVERGAAAANDAPGWSQSPWLRGLRNRLDFANRLWTQGVIRFDALRQKSVLTPFGLADADPGNLLMILSGVLGCAMLVAAAWALRMPRGSRGGDALDRAWARLGRRLARAGFAPAPQEGPLALQRRLGAAHPPLGAALGPLVEAYATLRYAYVEPPAQHVAAFAAAVRRFHPRRRARARP